MTSESKESRSIHDYELICTDCEFQATVEGTVHDALDVAEAHQEEHGGSAMDHFVTFELQGGTD